MFPFLLVAAFHLTLVALIVYCAKRKNRNLVMWGIFGFLNPLITLVVLAFLGKVSVCPNCQETIKFGAKKCRHCGEKVLAT